MSKSGYYLEKKAKQGFRGYPVATLAFYGPTADFASKVAVAVFRTEGGEPEVLERFFSEGADARFDEGIGERVLSVIQSHRVQSVVMTDSIIGCPHEEGVDYPEGTSCPQCPFWAGRDRWTQERIQ
ncbi:MAG: hypothetical protein DMG70_07895 [Acidobacteria bacterium]|nr:MAG: hypothetical protein DMG70_07895 [Acidobacteriota bacterium]PYY05707.1 MAG: hypothetical protein DMG69_25745 [Acidobacteriota bacterium]